MFSRFFRNEAPEHEDRLADAGPTPCEGPAADVHDSRVDAGVDSGPGVEVTTPVEGNQEFAREAPPSVDVAELGTEGHDRGKASNGAANDGPTGELAQQQHVPLGEKTDLNEVSAPASSVDPVEQAVPEPSLSRKRRLMSGPRRKVKGRRLARPEDEPARRTYTAEERLLLLDTWQRSGLPAKDFTALVGLSQATLYKWKRSFEEHGPAGLMDQPRGGPRGSRLPEVTKRTILMMKADHPEWGCQRISDMLMRGPALPASPSAVARLLHESGYERVEEPTHPHPDKVRRFERATPNQLWQTDLFTFVLKRQNRRVYLVAFMDDHSRFVTGYGLHASQSTALVLEVLRAAIASYGTPAEILTDNGSQYVTWRGKSAFTKELEKRGVRQIVARPRRPQTLGKIERFWGTLWRECVETAVFLDLGDARQRIGLFIDHYNFQRPHRGVDGLVPADRFFGAAPEVLKTLRQRVASNALELARQGVPKQPFYLTGQLDGQPFSVHREGDRVVLRRAEGQREEVELVPPAEEASCAAGGEQSPEQELARPICPDGSPSMTGRPTDVDPPLPGTSPLDGGLAQMARQSHGPHTQTSAGTPRQPPEDQSRDGRGGVG